MVRNLEIERKVGSKGQIVIPKEIRRITGIKPQMKVYVGIEKEKVVIRPRGREVIEEFLNIVPEKYKKVLKVKDWDRWYEEELEERWEKAKRAISRR